MKVEFNLGTCGAVPRKSLMVGDLFTIEPPHDGIEIYMATDSREYGAGPNDVSLADGVTSWECGDDDVLPVKATLAVER